MYKMLWYLITLTFQRIFFDVQYIWRLLLNSIIYDIINNIMYDFFLTKKKNVLFWKKYIKLPNPDSYRLVVEKKKQFFRGYIMFILWIFQANQWFTEINKRKQPNVLKVQLYSNNQKALNTKNERIIIPNTLQMSKNTA